MKSILCVMSEVLSLQAEAVAALAVECEKNCVGDEVNRTVSFRFAALSNVLRVSVSVSRVLLPPFVGNRLNPP